MNEILNKVKTHHDTVVQKYGDRAVFTCLVGSQNYGLAHEGSDIDTYTFLMPTLEELSTAAEPISTEFEVDDGKCCVKDMRLAMNLLIKTSPNSLEWFVSKYNIYSEQYADIMQEFQNPALHDWAHADYRNMVSAVAGMSRQLSTRNMPAGKRYAHVLRIRNLWFRYLYDGDPFTLMDFMDEKSHEEALAAKLDPGNEEYYENKIMEIAEVLNNCKAKFELVECLQEKETLCKATIRKYEEKLMLRNIEGF